MTVRPIRADEWSVLRSVRFAALKDSPAAFSETLTDAEAMPAEQWQGRAARGAAGEASFCALAFDDARPIGMAVGIPDQNNCTSAYLAAMWVAPAHRGAAVALALVNAIAAWSASRGRTMLFAGVLPGNARAAAFYRKAGFVEHHGPSPEHPTTVGSEIVLKKDLR